MHETPSPKVEPYVRHLAVDIEKQDITDGE